MAEGQQLSTEMISSDASLHADQAGWHIGEAWESGYRESSNAKLRDELRNGEIFYTIKEA
jgi:hypothetical protein